MEKKIQHKESRGLPGGPNEMFTYTTGIFSTEGFRMDSPDVNNYENIIPSGSITMKERDGSPLRKGPIYGVDNLGNQQVMYPGYDYEFPGTQVTERLMAKMGGGLLDKTIKCSSCGWEWKAADGGKDIMSCHKCPGKGLVKAEDGGENENPPDKVQDLNEITVYGNQEKIKLQGSLMDRLRQVKKAYNDHRVNLGLEKQRQSAEGTSSIISLKDQIQSYKKELDEEKKSYDKASKALNVLKKYNPESYKKAKVSDVLNATGVDDLRNLYKEGKISDATFMDFYDNFGKSYDREATRTTEEDQLKLEDSWYGQPDEEGRTRWMGNPNNVAKVAQTVAIGAPLAAAAPIMAPAIGATLAVPEISGGLNAYFGYHGLKEFGNEDSHTRKSMSRAYDDPTASNIGDATFDVGVNSLNFVGLPFGKAIKGSKNLMNNTYKINPWAFKPNPEAYYHRSPNLENIVNRETGTLQGFGNSKAGIEFSKDAGPGGTGNLAIRGDGSVSRINLKKPANSQLYFSKGVPLDGGRYNKVLNKKTGKLIDGQGYEGPYMVQVEGVPMGASTKGRAPGADVTNIGGYAVPRRPISLDEAKFYKEHWLQGYKEVPKQLPGSPNVGITNLEKELRASNQWLKKPLSEEEIKMYVELEKLQRFHNLPKTTNKESLEVLENFKTRIQTPEGIQRMKELGINNDKQLQKLEILEDPNTFGYYSGNHNKIVMNPSSPLPKKVTRHEIEHGVQDAMQEQLIKNEGNLIPTIKRLFTDPFQNKPWSDKIINANTEIDDLLSNLKLRKEGTPNKVWQSNIDSDSPVDINYYKPAVLDKQKATDYFLTGSEGREKSAFLGEVQQYMMDAGTLPKKGYIKVTPEMVKETMVDAMFDEKGGGKYLRLFNIMKADPENYELVAKGLNKMLGIAPLIGLGAAATQYQDGGEPIAQIDAANTVVPSPLIEYVVRKGDTLSKIASENNTSISSIMKNNEGITDPNVIRINQKISLVGKSPDAPQEEVYKDWNTIRDKKDRINKLSDEQKIVSFYNDKPEESYLIVDKKNAVMKLYTGGNLTKSFEVGVGQNPGDAQTVTKVKNGKTDWSAGNKSTGAGIYTISNINPASEEYYNEPSFNLKNENGIEVSTTIHGTPKPRMVKFNNGTVVDNRMTNGCINGKCEDLKELYGQLDLNTKVYILPEDLGNSFQIIDGKPALKVSSQNRVKYNSYVDQTGTKQKGQGANQTTNTLVYKPVKAVLNEAKFKEDVFQWNDFNDEKEYTSTTKPFVAALSSNKRDVMKAAKISSDVYNELAKMAFGIYGTESNYGDTHSAVGNLARATNKVLDPKSASSPDYKSKYETYGADEKTRSVGLTQIRWNYLNEDEKKALKQVGITSNKDFLDPKKAAIGTVTILGIRYNQQLNDKQKQDLWKYLPTKWNNRSNYGARVKSNSSYLSFKQLDKKQDGGEPDETSWTAYLNPANWGTYRYDEHANFKKAFRAARNDGESDFLWHGTRYTTELKKPESAAPVKKPKGITPELLIRQAYRESAFNPNAVSPAGYKGIGQIGEDVIKDYKKANNITGNIDPFNIKQNSDVQKYSMNELYNSSFINKPNQSEQVRLAKTLASYNWGRGNVANLLNDLKEEGVDIYNSLDWINKLPDEPKNYINDILFKKNTTFNNDFSKALSDQKNKPIKSLYGLRNGGESKPGPLMIAYNRLPKEKKMGGAIINRKEFGGQLNSGNITMYKDYIKGNIGNEIEVVKNYDKLNRMYYSKAKELGMTAANYIMTYIVGNS